MCNKLASTSRHVRVGLADPAMFPGVTYAKMHQVCMHLFSLFFVLFISFLHKGLTLCSLIGNICAAFFYCKIDGTSHCLQCDMIVHVGGKRTHGRYLLLRQRVEVCCFFTGED